MNGWDLRRERGSGTVPPSEWITVMAAAGLILLAILLGR